MNQNKDTMFLNSNTAIELYNQTKNLPIIDYHCHLSPEEIYEDKQFDNIAQMWLDADHYKWRLMRAFGIDEEYITGSKTHYEKFIKFASCIGMAAGNPLYHWTKMELSMYFDIDIPLNEKNADLIWNKANEVIKAKELSPRKLIELSNVEYIATTDDIVDTLEYHKLIAEDKTFKTKVTPSFRTDKLLLIHNDNYKDYIDGLSKASGVNVNDIDSLQTALINRLDYFCSIGCKFSDVGIEFFPQIIGTKSQADSVFKKAISGEDISDNEYNEFLFYMYVFLAGEYKKRNMVMQLHLAVKRNLNDDMFNKLGCDCGGDCIGDAVPYKSIITLLNEMNNNSGLPQTIIYTLNPVMYHGIATIAGGFKNVKLGAAWWFNDHKAGIEQQVNICAQSLHIATFLGMLTDSRSFLSYARHDYFRRILCNMVSEWIDKNEFENDENAVDLVKYISYENIKKVIGE